MRQRSAMRLSIIAISLTWSIILTGCWDIKDPQDVNYFTTIGFDYEDDHFVVYAQMIDFASVATSESSKPTEEMPVWVGKGIGDTAASAFNDLFESAQHRVFFGHISAIVLSDDILSRGITNVFDLTSRYHELRYTPWVYGTKDNIEELLSVTPFFNRSPLASMMHQPQGTYRQKSVIAPMMLREFIANIRERTTTALLPSIGIVESNWKASMKSKELLDLNGVYTFDYNKLNSHFRVDDIMGLRWMTPSTQRSPLVLRQQGQVYVEISLRDPKVKITPIIQDDKVKFRVNVSLKGEIIEVIEPISELRMEKLASDQVHEEIISTFEHAIARHVDIYSLEHVLYVKKHEWWRKHVKDRQMVLDQDSLEVEVKVDILSAGNMKLKPE